MSATFGSSKAWRIDYEMNTGGEFTFFATKAHDRLEAINALLDHLAEDTVLKVVKILKIEPFKGDPPVLPDSGFGDQITLTERIMDSEEQRRRTPPWEPSMADSLIESEGFL